MWWARVGFLLGVAGSLAGNLEAAWLRYASGGHPPYRQQAWAVVWPVLLVVSVEVMSRVPWPTGLSWRNAGWLLARFGGLGTVAASSAVISYGHMRLVLLDSGYGVIGTYAGAICLDAMMILCGYGMLAGRKETEEAPAAHAAAASKNPPPQAPTVDVPSEPEAPPVVTVLSSVPQPRREPQPKPGQKPGAYRCPLPCCGGATVTRTTYYRHKRNQPPAVRST